MQMQIEQETEFAFFRRRTMKIAMCWALMLIPAVDDVVAQFGKWELVPTPNVGESVNRFTAVSVIFADDAWANEIWRDVSGVAGPMALRWNVRRSGRSLLGFLPRYSNFARLVLSRLVFYAVLPGQ